jgi:hypothetical protein
MGYSKQLKENLVCQLTDGEQIRGSEFNQKMDEGHLEVLKLIAGLESNPNNHFTWKGNLGKHLWYNKDWEESLNTIFASFSEVNHQHPAEQESDAFFFKII